MQPSAPQTSECYAVEYSLVDKVHSQNSFDNHTAGRDDVIEEDMALALSLQPWANLPRLMSKRPETPLEHMQAVYFAWTSSEPGSSRLAPISTYLLMPADEGWKIQVSFKTPGTLNIMLNKAFISNMRDIPTPVHCLKCARWQLA